MAAAGELRAAVGLPALNGLSLLGVPAKYCNPEACELQELICHDSGSQKAENKASLVFDECPGPGSQMVLSHCVTVWQKGLRAL